MQLYLDVSRVSSGMFPPSNTADHQNAGLWHNYYMYSTLKRLQDFGTNDPSLNIWTAYFNSTTLELEQKRILPEGSSAVVDQIVTVLNAAQSTNNMATTIRQLSEIHQRTISDPLFKNTPILSVTSVAYYSALFLSQVLDNTTGEPLGIPKWLKGLAADIGGALGGMGLGDLLGPWGTVGGAIVGAAAGTIAAL